MTKKRGLGRGLGALIPGGEAGDEPGTGLRHIPVSAISPNPHQPRARLDETALDELAASIDEHGLIQPLVVTDAGDGRFTLIAGERRWRAAQRAGLTDVPVVVKEATSQAMLEWAIVENVQRADLNPLEEATAYRQLSETFGLTHAEVAERVGKSRSTVTNLMRLLSLPDNIQAAIVDGRISGAHARALLGLPTPEAQTAMLNTIVNLGLNVRQTEAAVNKMLTGSRPRPRPVRVVPPELSALEAQLQQALGTRVSIKKGRNGGQVVIHFYSDEELHAIYEAIAGEDRP